jgi:hypothetical protein
VGGQYLLLEVDFLGEGEVVVLVLAGRQLGLGAHSKYNEELLIIAMG